MNTTTIEEIEEHSVDMPGSQLAAVREAKGFSREYVAGKLHLRVRVIELLEEDDYEHMPESVFIKGYIRAYAKLLELDAEPLLKAFNRLGKTDKKSDKALWQSRRHSSNLAEHAVKWLTIAFAAGVIIAVSLWWHKNKDNEHFYSSNSEGNKAVENQSGSEVRLTDLSKMRSLLSSSQYSKSESLSE
ncbi:helix-turn-helix domain-containing protein [Legionella impletisoli]|uniref:DNA-binding protein n=1 Tax=Legionella impletisoli TaxID=343510 RepID=A0A917JM12_9GAMM|nr:helix-turn-helix domain-containing protein [Legionella impletisoli]GGI76196.1 DNA-binding protein [Legionella impletisoli]